MKKFLFLTLILGFLSVVSGAWYVYQNPEGIIHPQLIPPDYYWLDDPKDIYGETGIVAIAGREFEIPKGYFDGRPPSGHDTGSVVLEYSLPGFKVLPEHPQYRKDRQKLINEGRMRGMLLEVAAARPSFDIAVKNLMRGRDFSKEAEVTYGLEKYVHRVSEPISPEPQYAPYIEDDFFIERNADGSVKSYLRCSPHGKHKIPGCRHRFIDKGLLYNIHWNIADLPKWQDQRDAAIRFIESMEIKPKEKE